MLFIQLLINGIMLGVLYAAIAVGFSLVWGVINVINLAHGVMVVLGALVTHWFFSTFGINPLLIIPISILVLFAIGFCAQKYGLNRIIRAPMYMTFIFTFGLGLIIENLSSIIFGGDYRSAAASSVKNIILGTLSIPYMRVAVSILAIILVVGFYLYMEKTKTGNAIRATRMNSDAAKLMGIDVGKIYAITFGISAAMAGASGSLVSTAYVFTPTAGPGYLFTAFVACIIGGLGNINGALVGGVVLGLIETYGSIVFGPGFRETIGMVALVLILIIRPRGILGMEYYE
ncbi:MAG: branched-chain amino acid ABC transporter permease [Bacillota bacterium]